MKKNYLVFVSLAVICIFATTACKKSSSGKSKTEIVTTGTWKFDDMGADMNKDGSIDLSDIDECMEDNTVTFSANGSGSTNEGADICDGSNQTDSWTWSFKNNESVISIDIEELGDVTLLTLTDTELKGYKEIDNPFGSGTIWAVVKLKR
jgi:hypothetical protein